MTGRLELPMPELGKNSLSKLAKDMEKKIKAQTPDSLRQSVKARPYKKGDATGIAIDYDDRAEQFVYIAMEYPKGTSREETVDPKGSED